jgi:lipopolysaccharide heptosyltransferase II
LNPTLPLKKVVLIDWSMIGDLVMMSPCIRAIRENFPNVHLAVLGQPSSLSIYRHHPGVDELIFYDRSHGDFNIGSFMRTVKELREGRFDAAFVIHGSIGSALMAALGRAKHRIGYRREMRDVLLTHKYTLEIGREHLIEEKLDLLRNYGLEASNVAEEVFIDEARAGDWLKEKLGPNFGRSRPIVTISAGASTLSKRWKPDSLHDLVNRFPVNSVDLVFIGGPAETHLYEGVYSYNNTVVNLVGQTTIEELTWVLDRSDLFIGPDSGPVHLAVGRGRPVVALFGPTDPARCGPYRYEQGVVVRAERICPECNLKLGKQIRQCLCTLDVDEIYSASTELLEKYCKKWKKSQQN